MIREFLSMDIINFPNEIRMKEKGKKEREEERNFLQVPLNWYSFKTAEWNVLVTPNTGPVLCQSYLNEMRWLDQFYDCDLSMFSTRKKVHSWVIKRKEWPTMTRIRNFDSKLRVATLRFVPWVAHVFNAISHPSFHVIDHNQVCFTSSFFLEYSDCNLLITAH